MKNKQWKSAGWLASLMFIGGLSSCSNGGQSQKNSALDTQPIAGSVEVINGDSIWVCNLSALKDTVVLPLSYFADELQIVKLDNRDEALVPVRNVIVSDNYILVWGKDQTPFKLFDKSGKFLANFPVPVFLKRFAAALQVLIFGIVNSSLNCISIIFNVFPLKTWSCFCLQPSVPSPLLPHLQAALQNHQAHVCCLPYVPFLFRGNVMLPLLCHPWRGTFWRR